jgi:ectoine hydroxylase-related dioxygenase (phytanoyl-CoA dioxygenase family)
MLNAGHAAYAHVLDPGELNDLTAALGCAPQTRTRAGARHLMMVPEVRRLANDPRLLAIARPWLAGGAVPFRATLFDKSSNANWLVTWHQDTALPVEQRRDMPGWGSWSEKAGILYAHAPASALNEVIALRLHIDDSNADNGPLRVLPGTHRLGVLSDAEVHDCAGRITAVTCCASAGSVVVMRPLTVHASSKARSPCSRRVLHVEYAQTLQTSDGMQLRIA